MLLMTPTLADEQGTSALFSALFSPQEQGKNRNRADLCAANLLAIKKLRPCAGRFQDTLTGEI
jgi:hypothetical protein